MPYHAEKTRKLRFIFTSLFLFISIFLLPHTAKSLISDPLCSLEPAPKEISEIQFAIKKMNSAFDDSLGKLPVDKLTGVWFSALNEFRHFDLEQKTKLSRAFFRKMQTVKSAWRAREFQGSDGATIYYGLTGFIVALRPSRDIDKEEVRVFKGKIEAQNRLHNMYDGILLDYTAMTLLE